MDNLIEEKENLYNTINIIDNEIQNSKKELSELINIGKALSFEDRKRGEHFNVNSQADLITKKIHLLQNSRNIPYFGRIDISKSGTDGEKLYIGRSGILSKGRTIVTDWRAPVSSLYYDSEVGPVVYNAPSGDIHTNLLLKRQINIKNSELINIQDSSLVTNDDLLKPYLEINADNRMKTIIASIQKEQNAIIRKPANKDIIIQGVAGSGKTSVALHRIAYLIYEQGAKISPDSFLVIGPNDYFLNYVSSILPDLETSPVEEETLLKYTKNYINDKINLRENLEYKDIDEEYSIRKIQAFKTSLEFKTVLDDFLEKYFDKEVISKDFKVLDDVIFTKEQMHGYLFDSSSKLPNYDKLTKILISKLKNNLIEIYETINTKYKLIYTDQKVDKLEREKAVQYSDSLYKLLKNDAIKLVKNFVKSIQTSVLDVYASFISDIINMECSLNELDKLRLKKLTLNDIKSKKIGYEDIPALIHIGYKFSNKTNNYKQIVIDEAQDYGLFHFYALKETNPDSNFSIYGDLAQSIYSYRSINDWNEVNDKILNGNAEILTMSKSYRTTIEITENANNILKYLRLQEAQPVIRNGVNVEFVDSSYNSNYKIAKIMDMLEKKYQTIAIICKDEVETKKVFKELQKLGIPVKIISDKDTEYKGGLFVLSASSSKGLEFDGVIINNASEMLYNSNSDVDMHLLYVASTRALHELCILYDCDLVNVYKNSLDLNQYQKKIIRK